MDAWAGMAFLFGLGIGFIGGWLYVTLARMSAEKADEKKKEKYAIRRLNASKRVRTLVVNKRKGRGGIAAF